jgi:hypothetical protein
MKVKKLGKKGRAVKNQIEKGGKVNKKLKYKKGEKGGEKLTLKK